MEYQVVPIKGRQLISPLKEQLLAFNQTFGWSVEQSEADFANEYSEYYCLVDKEMVLGYVGLHHVLDEASINHVYIQPDYRQQGLAHALINFVLTQLAYRQVKHLFLEVRANNQAAIRLYEASGFELLGRRNNYYQHPVEDALIYQKKVG
ncbi:ribosomal protein S18-alanine N-acetyltransferase [Tuanshanicoccus lijuaniae]|uniref:ribosomal protein S18-alanine N-acetyltransferase n=1 Tax=Aerococcaceae bacterium zg-1292 TaxID=2774330 RepID=UPI001935567C|nr:ribosomal protein S18-alanine N-acetyltransferase [Aerococcaceae bacterium zg-1292]MBF6625223.1 ribosomal protein S18-alanine N-acetyltransferase [Aerococcaceae bacterium zg-BR9]QQA37344.1 ribosomal protein S18-alanine N-acetyltransferase [Aerococcaceae bacterium zg-1292]